MLQQLKRLDPYEHLEKPITEVRQRFNVILIGRIGEAKPPGQLGGFFLAVRPATDLSCRHCFKRGVRMWQRVR